MSIQMPTQSPSQQAGDHTGKQQQQGTSDKVKTQGQQQTAGTDTAGKPQIRDWASI